MGSIHVNDARARLPNSGRQYNFSVLFSVLYAIAISGLATSNFTRHRRRRRRRFDSGWLNCRPNRAERMVSHQQQLSQC